mgnify:CR=1 FL=1
MKKYFVNFIIISSFFFVSCNGQQKDGTSSKPKDLYQAYFDAKKKFDKKYTSHFPNVVVVDSLFSLGTDSENKTLDELSEDLGNEEKSFDIDDNSLVFSTETTKAKQNYSIGMLLHKCLYDFSKNNYGILNEKEIWAYFAHLPIFRKYIIERFFNLNLEDDENDLEEKHKNKIQRYFFRQKTPSRTGIYFYWSMADNLYDEVKKYKLLDTAFLYIDSVKGIYEREIKKNRNIIKAFVEGIELNYKSQAFRDSKYRSIIPTHISNIAAINFLDAYEYSDLVKKIANEQSLIIAEYNREKAQSGF